MRKNGILLHISSLPSNYGIGKLGNSAYDFVRFLNAGKVTYWQILPISPTSYGDSPYQSFSVNAGNPYFIDFELLEEDGLLDWDEYGYAEWEENPRRVNYSMIYKEIFDVLRIAFERFKKLGNVKKADYRKFVAAQKSWLNEYAFFMALKFKNGGKAWYEWEKPLAMRDTAAIAASKKELEDEIEFFKFLQYKFFEQWYKLKAFANSQGVKIIGDIPIYAAYDSVEAWANPKLFAFDKDKKPIAVAGCPPDGYSPTGQLWGNPVYDWAYHRKTGYSWWVNRIKFATEVYDVVRIDHFRGFESFYAIPFGAETAEAGEWRKGPNAELFKVAEEKLGKLNIIAEDLGFLTPEVSQMLEEVGYPGMKVLQFAFDKGKNGYLPHNYSTTNSFVYTGTHDNETLQGWASGMSKKSLKFAKEYLGVKKRRELADAVIRQAWASVGITAIAQMQDFLDCTADDRMNTPSTLGCNWQYRTVASDFTPKLVKKIRNLNRIYNRIGGKDESTD